MLSPYNFFVFVLTICLSLSCSNDLKDIQALTPDELANTEWAKNVEILYSDSAIVRLRLNAPIMLNKQEQQKPKREFPDGISVDFFDANQFQTSELTAKYAEYLELQKYIVLKDSIVLWNYKNEQLETEELIWDEKDGRIYSNKFVKITTPTEVILGYGFSSNMEFTAWEIDSVSGIFQAQNLLEGSR